MRSLSMGATCSIGRRDFLRKCLTGAAVLGASGSVGLLATAEQGKALAKSRVVIARDAMLRGTGTTVDSRRMLSLVDRAMQALFDRDNPIETWKKLVRPGETVGLKVNALGGRGFCSNPLVEAICERLQEAGIKAERYRGLGPRQRRTGTRRIPCVDRRKPCSMLRHRSSGLRARAGHA